MANRHFISKLSRPQLYALSIARYYKLSRSSMGWWVVGHPTWGVTEPVQILSPATVMSLWHKGLLDGIPYKNICTKTSAKPELWINDKGKQLLDEISRDTKIVFDPESDELIVSFNTDEFANAKHH